MSDQILTKIREQNKVRAKRYYEINKKKIADRRKALRDANKPEATFIPIVQPVEPVEPEPVEPVEPVKKGIKIRISKPITKEDAIKILTEKIDNVSTRNVHIGTLNTIATILDCSNIAKCFRDYKSTIDKIDHSKQVTDPTKEYATNTKKRFYQTILKLSEIVPINLSQEAKNAYVDRFKLTDIISRDDNKERASTGNLTPFDSYLPLVKNKFGEISKEYIIASLYQLHGFRDNLQLQIKNIMPSSTEHNYIVVPARADATIALNTYKTEKKLGAQHIKVPKALSDVIRKYIKIHNLHIDDYLLGESLLSPFIKRFNDKLELPITINTYRQMHVSAMPENADPQERLELAKKMGHSPQSSDHYRRTMKK